MVPAPDAWVVGVERLVCELQNGCLVGKAVRMAVMLTRQVELNRALLRLLAQVWGRPEQYTQKPLTIHFIPPTCRDKRTMPDATN